MIPGRNTRDLGARLRARESRNVTYLSDEFPVFWDSASGATVTDVDGNRYIDCTAGFGVANLGHSDPHVAAAVAAQAARLMHGLGDVHPTEIRVRLFERLAEVLPSGLEKFFMATTGSEAVEAALKTAILHTGKARFAAYRGGYHGLSFGALAVSGIDRFRAPFAPALGVEPLLLEYPREGVIDAAASADRSDRELDGRDDLAALIVEPIQGRAGIIVPPPGYLRAMRRICDERGIVMIVDEIYTGFGRTGDWFAVEREGVTPDILCIGKAMGSGFPIGAIAGREDVMDAWPLSEGEALHTSTFLGNPLGCAAALATLDELARRRLVERAREFGDWLARRLQPLRANRDVLEVRGRGLLAGIQLGDARCAARVVAKMLRAGVIVLQSGVAGEVIAISPPLTIAQEQLARAIDALEAAIREEGAIA